jgi:hypothetical protein
MSELRLRQPFYTVQDVLGDAEYVSGIQFPRPIPVADLSCSAPKSSKKVKEKVEEPDRPRRRHSRPRDSPKHFTAIPETEKSLGRVEEDAPCQLPSAAMQADIQRRLESIVKEKSSTRVCVCEESGQFCQQKSELAGVHRLQNRYPFKNA